MKTTNPLDYFDGIFCINLAFRTDRREVMEREFESVGILDRVEWFNAIQSSNEGGPSGRRVSGTLKWKNIDGNNLSNMSCIKLARERGWRNVLIFEDDVYFRETWQLDGVVADLKTQDWGLFFLGGTLDTRDGSLHEQVGDNLFKVRFPVYGTSAYAVNHKMFDNIINNQIIKVDWKKPEVVSHHKRIWNLDVLLGRKFGKKFVPRSPICLQRAGWSELNKMEIDHHAKSCEDFSRVFGDD